MFRWLNNFNPSSGATLAMHRQDRGGLPPCISGLRRPLDTKFGWLTEEHDKWWFPLSFSLTQDLSGPIDFIHEQRIFCRNLEVNFIGPNNHFEQKWILPSWSAPQKLTSNHFYIIWSTFKIWLNYDRSPTGRRPPYPDGLSHSRPYDKTWNLRYWKLQ